ncbi:serine hydrolase domain-containing protein [Streptomyces mangrovisoli]|uniref:Serine hydrolase n=1 Tax=Streptomyces mangrovisoli TaxID=1428628 RepID=A0A1J4NR43_9ACTN|nr:serine hydrolase domain-containing protein [Streptomyces mangrovisoli]OIJ64913.1 serine hydrolase [Streptomyces mangrovisoli]
MSDLYDVLRRHVDDGTVPGAVGLVARGEDVEVVAVGSVDADGSAPMARDSLFRLASITKPVVAAGLLTLLDDGTVGLDDPVARWLPELEKPVVVRTPGSPLDDVVPAVRPITVEHLLSSRPGWGFPDDFGLPAVRALFEVRDPTRSPQLSADQDGWLAALSRVPLLHQPGDAWLYNTASDLQGALISRASGRSLPDFLAERLFEPLGMADTGFAVPPGKRHRFTSAYRPDGVGALVRTDTPDGDYAELPPFASGAGGLVSTADDWLAFGRLLLNGGEADGRRLLTRSSVARMTTDHLTAAQRAAGALFLEGQGWGYGGQVDIAPVDPWNVPGRYGWVGGSGTTAHVVPRTGTVGVLLTQVSMENPTPTPLMRAFWRYAAGVI